MCYMGKNDLTNNILVAICSRLPTKDMLELAKQTGLDLNKAKQIIEQVKEVLKD